MTVHARDVSTMTLDEVRAEVGEIQPKLGKAFEEAGPTYDTSKITVFEGDTPAKSQMLHDLNARLGVLTERKEELIRLDAAKAATEGAGRWLDMPRGKTPTTFYPSDETRSERKSLGELFVESQAGHEKKGDEVEVDGYGAAEAKADFTTGAGWAPESTRSGRVVLTAQQAPTVLDLVPIIGTEQAAYIFMEETTFTNNAAEVAEGGQFGEAALALTERTQPIRKIAVFLPATDEQLADVNEARSYVDARLGFMLRKRLDGQLLVGDGEAPNITGYFEKSGINVQAKGGDPVFDAIHKGITKVESVGFADPDAIVTRPDVWETMRLTRTADGLYIMGHPADDTPKRLFGLPAVTTTSVPAGKALVGAFQAHSALALRQGIEFKVSDSHADYFIKGKQAIRATMRGALVIFRASAFTEVTGLAS